MLEMNKDLSCQSLFSQSTKGQIHLPGFK